MGEDEREVEDTDTIKSRGLQRMDEGEERREMEEKEHEMKGASLMDIV